MLNKFQLLTINRKISSAKRILIVSHSNPDGDAVGASLALYHFFKEQQYIVHIILPNDFPSFYTWMPGSEKIIIYENNKLGAEEIVNSANVIFCLDFNALSRIGKLGSIIKTSSAFRIMIDHHPYPEDEFDIIFSQINTSSTSELVYDFIFQLEKDELINKEIAECIYTGIMTDTGSFSYSCNYEKTYRLIAQLFRLGINGEKIHQLVYDTYSEDRMRLLGFCLKERLVVNKELGTAYIYLSKDDLAKYDYQVGDTEGVVNYALAISGINFAVLFTEKENIVRLSLRSKGNFKVNEFANKHFKGGGHANAAGADSELSFSETLQYFESLLPAYKQQLTCVCE